jgi:hypothetical protein
MKATSTARHGRPLGAKRGQQIWASLAADPEATGLRRQVVIDSRERHPRGRHPRPSAGDELLPGGRDLPGSSAMSAWELETPRVGQELYAAVYHGV